MQYFAYMTWLPQYLVEVMGLDNMGATAAYALPVTVLLGFNILTGFLLGAGVPLAALLLSALLSQAAVWWLIPYCQSIGAGTALLVLYGIGAGITPTCLFALPGAIMGRAGAPTAFGFIMTGRNIGVFLGPILLAEATKLLRRLERGLAAVRQHDAGRDGRGWRARADAADEPERAGEPATFKVPGGNRRARSPGSRPGSDRARSSGAGGRHGSPAYGW